jgi:hypothetical protein
MKNKKGPATPDEQNSPNISMQSTVYGSVGMGLECDEGGFNGKIDGTLT